MSAFYNTVFKWGLFWSFVPVFFDTHWALVYFDSLDEILQKLQNKKEKTFYPLSLSRHSVCAFQATNFRNCVGYIFCASCVTYSLQHHNHFLLFFFSHISLHLYYMPWLFKAVFLNMFCIMYLHNNISRAEVFLHRHQIRNVVLSAHITMDIM